MTTTDTLFLPDYAPIPRSAIGPALNEQGYYAGRVERNLYWVTDGTYQSAFLTTSDGVVVFDAPPTIGHNIQRAVDDIAAANGVSNQVNYLIYSHHHSDHAGASSLFGRNVTRIGHEETRCLLLRDDDPARPPNEETFADHRTLEIGGERIDLAWHGANHSPDNIIIHLPDHDTLMLIDIVTPGWATSYKIGVAEERAGSLFPLGGAGSLALGVWALRRGGMPADEIARKTVAFFLLTSAVPVGMLLLLGAGLAMGILPGGGGLLLTVLPAVVAAGAIAATLALRRLAHRAEARIRRQREESRWARRAPAVSATSDGVDEALHQLRQANPLLVVGLVAFLVFDMLAFWASFRAVGASPELAVIWMAYLIGQLGNWLPVPGGIGGVELGLVGVLVLYGLPALTATAAVLLYRVIELWIPAVLGIAAFLQLRLLLRRETDAIKLCTPGDTIEIVGLGPATINRSEG
jgi:uncharacterized membrane protein YbhN (UPF0104 family)/glyoxylase-like metal-dependent hydrolase (beta-lactamase superfamily II)